jgi:hypothetical protein
LYSPIFNDLSNERFGNLEELCCFEELGVPGYGKHWVFHPASKLIFYLFSNHLIFLSVDCSLKIIFFFFFNLWIEPRIVNFFDLVDFILGLGLIVLLSVGAGSTRTEFPLALGIDVR